MSKTFSKRGDGGRTTTSSRRLPSRRFLKHSQHWKPPALREHQDCVRPSQAADSYYKKNCLSAFDNKRYILPDGIKIITFGYYEIGDYDIDEIDWNNDDVERYYDNFSDLILSSSPEWFNSFVVPHSSLDTTTPSSNTWQPLDPGFVAAQNISDSDTESNDIVDFDASFGENSTPDNPFIYFEAEEATESESEGPLCKTARQYYSA